MTYLTARHIQKAPVHYVNCADQRYHLRQVTEPTGQTQRTVWALYMGHTRIHEVHALTNLQIVADDARDYIRAAKAARVAG